MSDEAERWTKRVKLVEERAAFAREVLDGRLDHLLPYLHLFRSRTRFEWLKDTLVAVVGAFEQLVGYTRWR